MAHGFHGRQERFHFLLRHRPTSVFPRHGNPRISQRGGHLKAASRSKTGKHGYASRRKSYFAYVATGQADSRADAAIRVRGNLSRHVVEQLVAESCRLVESAWGVHLRGHRELTGSDEDLDSDRVVFERPAQSKALVRLREPVPTQRANPRAAQRAHEPPQVD